MKNSTEIKTTTYGTASVSLHTESERKNFYITLFNRIQELYQKSQNDHRTCACLDTSEVKNL